MIARFSDASNIPDGCLTALDHEFETPISKSYANLGSLNRPVTSSNSQSQELIYAGSGPSLHVFNRQTPSLIPPQRPPFRHYNPSIHFHLLGSPIMNPSLMEDLLKQVTRSPFQVVAIGASLVALGYVCIKGAYGNEKTTNRHPPGPRGDLFIGNLRQFPKSRFSATFCNWAKQYGEYCVIHLGVLNLTKYI